MQHQESIFKRDIKSYVLRSRKTPRQRVALEQLWDVYGLEITDKPINLPDLFSQKGSIILEIGFGMGSSLVRLAELNPHLNFIGIEVHRPGVGAILGAIQEKKLANLRIICGDAVELIARMFVDQSLYGVLLFFPDPWPKRRHHKRRIVQPAFVDLIASKLQNNGYFHLATDVLEYAVHMRRVLNNHPHFTLMNESGRLPHQLERPKTKFECRGERLGHSISDLVYIKNTL